MAKVAPSAPASAPVEETPPPLHPLLGRLLAEHHLTSQDLDTLLKEKSPLPREMAPLKALLVQLKLVPEETLQQAQAELFGLEYRAQLEDVIPDPVFAKEIPIRYAKRFMFYPLQLTPEELVVAVENPEEFEPVEDAGRKFRRPVRHVVSTRQSIMSLINRAYNMANRGTEQAIEGFEAPDDGAPPGPGGWGIEEPEDLIDARDEEPIKRLLNSILYQAARSNTSDVHIDSTPSEVVIRFRVDGELHTVTTLPKAVHLTMINRIKVMSRLDISQRGLPQDGRTLILIAGRRIDIRVSTLPTVHGEKAVMRLLYQDQEMFDLRKLGMPEDIYAHVKKLIRQSGGIILVSGPTGSGKTTTLYAALREIDHHTNNIMTIEDPVEYKIPGYVQTEINPKLGLTFANALRSVLRQDPDVIMVGEMRDRETAIIAIQAALTGHTVFSTVHTNDAPSTITRLVDMGIEPYLVSSTVMAVLAQRLLRRICSHCKVQVEPDEVLLLELGLTSKEIKAVKTLYKGAGCGQCRGSGYLGRVGVYELLMMSDPVKKLLLTSNEANQIRDAATANGMVTMRQYGLQMVMAGMTTVEELVSAAKEE
ncbi:MAG: ATPase, T2SS/T4P/T4SS family [Deltaproteobacteria bacterium]|nr:ATPase, T2SS/T4P/T4SS family [Deltaproteobacteria bacterium]